MRVVDGEKVFKRDVKIGKIHEDSVEIIGGLKDGELVVISRNTYLKDGELIQIEEKGER